MAKKLVQLRLSTARMSAALLALTGALLLAASCVTIERGIEITPEPLPEELVGARWQSLPVSYCFVRSNLSFVPHETFVQLTNDAFAQWGVPTRSEGDCNEAGERNGRNEITWGEAPDLAPGAGYEAGYSRLIYSRCVRNCPEDTRTTISEADIFIDPTTPQRSQTEECLFSTLLHEAGHFLGVPHLESPAVMAPVSNDCPQELTDADRQALAELYGPRAAVE